MSWDGSAERNEELFDIVDVYVCRPENRGRIGSYGQPGTLTAGSWLKLRDLLRPLLLEPFAFIDVGAADGRMCFIVGAHELCLSSFGIEVDVGVLRSRRKGSKIAGGGGRRIIFDASVMAFGEHMHLRGVSFNSHLLDVMYDTDVGSMGVEIFPSPPGCELVQVPKFVYMFNDGWSARDRNAASAICATDPAVRVVVTCMPGESGSVSSYVEVELGSLGQSFVFVGSVSVTMCGSGEGKTLCVFKRKG